jgi:pSer/pThr/pTyr-binding forkhead associated (FHA) protein
MTNPQKDFDADWPAVLELMSVFIRENLPLSGGEPPRVTLHLSSRKVKPAAMQPHLADWLDDWRRRGIEVQHVPSRGEKHTVSIETSTKKGGLFRWLKEVVGIPTEDDPLSPPVKPKRGETDAGQADQAPEPDGGGDYYQPIEDALKAWIGEFARGKGAAHRKIAPNKVFAVEWIELYPVRPELDRLLAEFLEQFEPGDRVGWLKRVFASHPNANLSADQLHEFGRLRDGSRPAEDIADRMSRAGRNPSYLVFEKGDWIERPAAPPPPPPLPPEPKRPPRPGASALAVEVLDRLCPSPGQARVVELADADIVIGREGNLRVDGEFVSRRHCRLLLSGTGATLEDLGSANGTYIDGRPLPAGEVRPLAGRVEIRLGSDGGAEPGAYAKYPLIRCKLPTPGRAASLATPIRQPVGPQATPVIGMKKALAELVIQDQGGSRRFAIEGVPFRVGRSTDCEAVIREDNQGVSRQHLVIESIEQDGARVRLVGKYGAAVAGQTVAETGFLWRWNTPMELAVRVKSDYPLTPVLTLKRIE